jgi:ferredoxin--NADP+ reductase
MAPQVAKRWRAGQFVIIRPTPESERIPLTIVAGDAREGTLTLVIQEVGATTQEACRLQVGQSLANLVGPLGEPATVESFGVIWCVAGGVGVAEVLPVARTLREAGNYVVVLAGARSASRRILDAELRAAADEVHWATDDGSAGFPGTVVDLMSHLRRRGSRVDAIHAIGPIPMMRAAADLTRSWGIRAFASLNPIMIDGTGMCGGCRVLVGGAVRFACVEGPEFDAHQVDFDQLAKRNAAYREQERLALERVRRCAMNEMEVGRLATRMMDRICRVCPDRNVDGTCDRLADGECTLLAKLPQAAEAVLRVSSEYLEPYIQSIRDHVCVHCDLHYADGSCDARKTDHCMLNSYLPIVVEVIEEHFGRTLAGNPVAALK